MAGVAWIGEAAGVDGGTVGLPPSGVCGWSLAASCLGRRVHAYPAVRRSRGIVVVVVTAAAGRWLVTKARKPAQLVLVLVGPS